MSAGRTLLAVASCLALHVGDAWSQDARSLDELLNAFAQDKDLRSPSLASSAQAVLASATNREEQITAKILLAQALAARSYRELETNDIIRARQLWTEVKESAPGTWLVVELSGQGKRAEMIVKAKDALAAMNFDVLEKSQDPALGVLRAEYGNRPNIFREALKGALVNSLCDDRRVTEAKEAYKDIQDPEFAEIMLKRIRLAEKEEAERKARAAANSQSAIHP